MQWAEFSNALRQTVGVTRTLVNMSIKMQIWKYCICDFAVTDFSGRSWNDLNRCRQRWLNNYHGRGRVSALFCFIGCQFITCGCLFHSRRLHLLRCRSCRCRRPLWELSFGALNKSLRPRPFLALAAAVSTVYAACFSWLCCCLRFCWKQCRTRLWTGSWWQ